MLIRLKDPSLVLLVGVSGSGKSTFAIRNFNTTEIVSADKARSWISDDIENQEVNNDAFRIVHDLVRTRLLYKKMTCVDNINVTPASRRDLLRHAQLTGMPTYAIRFDTPYEVCMERQRTRGREVPEHVVGKQWKSLYDHERLITSFPADQLGTEGFTGIWVIPYGVSEPRVMRERE